MKRLEETCRRISYRLNEDAPLLRRSAAPLSIAFHLSHLSEPRQAASGIEVRLELNLHRAFARMLNLRPWVRRAVRRVQVAHFSLGAIGWRFPAAGYEADWRVWSGSPPDLQVQPSPSFRLLDNKLDRRQKQSITSRAEVWRWSVRSVRAGMHNHQTSCCRCDRSS